MVMSENQKDMYCQVKGTDRPSVKRGYANCYPLRAK